MYTQEKIYDTYQFLFDKVQKKEITISEWINFCEKILELFLEENKELLKRLKENSQIISEICEDMEDEQRNF